LWAFATIARTVFTSLALCADSVTTGRRTRTAIYHTVCASFCVLADKISTFRWALATILRASFTIFCFAVANPVLTSGWTLTALIFSVLRSLKSVLANAKSLGILLVSRRSMTDKNLFVVLATRIVFAAAIVITLIGNFLI
jgi:hypothetical protein